MKPGVKMHEASKAQSSEPSGDSFVEWMEGPAF